MVTIVRSSGSNPIFFFRTLLNYNIQTVADGLWKLGLRNRYSQRLLGICWRLELLRGMISEKGLYGMLSGVVTTALLQPF